VSEAGTGRSSLTAPRFGLAAGLGLLLLGALIGALVLRIADRPRVEAIVHSYLVEHPEVLREAGAALQRQDAARVIAANRGLIETPFAGAWAGAKDADVTLVEFFDYACTFCRRSNPDLDRLLAEDRKLRIVWREWPVLGPASEEAAKASLAAARQGRFKPFHDAMFALGRPSAETIAQALRQSGVSPPPAQDAEARSEIEKNYSIARAIGGTGTPTFVVGDRVVQGAVGYDNLRRAIEEARRRG
jgi:protein-disulfide isomerase